MRSFSGSGGELYAIGEASAFVNVPMDDCGDGFTWRSADGSARTWLEGNPLTFRVYEDGLWSAVDAEEVCYVAAQVRFGRCLSGLHVLANCAAMPTSLIGEGERWSLNQVIVEGEAMGGYVAGKGSATARIFGLGDALGSSSPIRRVLAVLPSAAGAFFGLGEIESGAPDVSVTFDQRGVIYA